ATDYNGKFEAVEGALKEQNSKIAELQDDIKKLKDDKSMLDQKKREVEDAGRKLRMRLPPCIRRWRF
ncbi:hypothetical protein Dimus_026907, partial [Dionaea muscipula]